MGTGMRYGNEKCVPFEKQENGNGNENSVDRGNVIEIV